MMRTGLRMLFAKDDETASANHQCHQLAKKAALSDRRNDENMLTIG
jgi:hypothetical protein